jgi:hypothetical protein
MHRIWRLFWHGFRIGYGARCARCGDYEYSPLHPRGMRGRRIGRWYI